MLINFRDMEVRAKALLGRQWITGNYVKKTINGKTQTYIIPIEDEEYISVTDEYTGQKMYRVDLRTLGLSTGKTDVDGNKIFTGDIIVTTDADDCIYSEGWRCLVLYDEEDDFFFAEGAVTLYAEDLSWCRVIGNMYDNQDILDKIESEL